MSTTLIEYNNGKGFWIHEIYMQLAYCYIYEELKKPQNTVTNKNQLLYEIQFHIDGYSTGIMSLGWNNFITNQLDKQTTIQALQNVKTTLKNKGAFISVSELQSIPTEDEDFKIYYREPFPTAELIKIIDALIQMLQGTWTSDNYSMAISYK
jgi:hypothetical protein